MALIRTLSQYAKAFIFSNKSSLTINVARVSFSLVPICEVLVIYLFGAFGSATTGAASAGLVSPNNEFKPPEKLFFAITLLYFVYLVNIVYQVILVYFLFNISFANAK